MCCSPAHLHAATWQGGCWRSLGVAIAGAELCDVRVFLSCSLPQLLKAKGRAAWEAVQANLLLSLQKLDLDAQVQQAAASAACHDAIHVLPGNCNTCMVLMGCAQSRDGAKQQCFALIQHVNKNICSTAVDVAVFPAVLACFSAACRS